MSSALLELPLQLHENFPGAEFCAPQSLSVRRWQDKLLSCQPTQELRAIGSALKRQINNASGCNSNKATSVGLIHTFQVAYT